MDIEDPNAKFYEIKINPGDYKITMQISPERQELREKIYNSVIRVAERLYHINSISPNDISSLGEYMVKSLDEIYEQIKKMDEAEGRAT